MEIAQPTALKFAMMTSCHHHCHQNCICQQPLSSDLPGNHLQSMLDGAIPFVIQTMESKQANKFKTCQGTVLSKFI